MIQVPSGAIGLEFMKPRLDPVSGNRTQWFTFHLEDNDGVPKGDLEGVTGGEITWVSNAQVRAGGKITIEQDAANEINWLKRRIKVVMHIKDLDSFPLGVFIPSAPSEVWSQTGLTLDVELLDKSSVLAQDAVQHTYSLAAGTNVTDTVRSLIASTGERAGSITDSNETLADAMTWEPGTSKLEIVNDMLEAAGFFGLFADGNGAFRVERQRPAKDRPVRHRFLDDENVIYLADFSYDKDLYAVPNKVVLIGQGTAETEAPVAIATNQNPDSPFSYQQRGRWIVDVQTGIEATTQANLEARAERRLAQLSSPTGTINIDHAPLPWLDVTDVVQFRRNKADINVKAVITQTQISFDPTALQRTQLREVVEL